MLDPQGAVIRVLDANDRLVLPESLANRFSAEMVLAPGFDYCIRVYSVQVWEQFGQRLGQLDADDPDNADFLRFFSSMTCRVTRDRNGRLRIPEVLMKWAGLDEDHREVQVFEQSAGCMEIWETSRFRQFMGEKTPMFKEMARRVFGRRPAPEATEHGGVSPAGDGA